MPESTASEIQALYREAAQAEPDAMLDRRILDAARAELRGAAGTKARRQPPWWKGWLPAASALAIALVGVSVTWRVMDQQERDLRQEMKAADSVRERSGAAADSAAPAQGAADLPRLPRAPAPAADNSHRAEPRAEKDAPPGATESAPMPASATPAPMGPAAPAAPVIADQAVKKSARAENEDLRERRDAAAAIGADSAPARQAVKLEAGGPAIGSSGAAAAESLAGSSAKPAAKSAVGSISQPPPDAPTAEAWLKHIRELRTAGRGAEAAQSLARFRARYPDFALPEDLLDLR
jgi:hypothetical protein